MKESAMADTPRQYICPDCRNVFFQPFKCTTCGAQKLRDHTQATLERENSDLRAELEAAKRELAEQDNTITNLRHNDKCNADMALREQTRARMLEARLNTVMLEIETPSAVLTGRCMALREDLARAQREAQSAREEASKYKRRLAAVMPLFEEARDALPAISVATAKLRGISLTLANRMDDVGIPERWEAREAALAKGGNSNG